MKRLIKQINSKNKLKRLVKKAEWTPVDTDGSDIVQIITDAMAMGTQVQIEYQGSGWRLIQPYGWNTSKEGNILLMCYKDTGEIRSYRLDRILQLLIDDTMLNNEPVINKMYEVSDYSADPNDFEIPELPNIDEILDLSENESGTELPYGAALNYLIDDSTDENIGLENEVIIGPNELAQQNYDQEDGDIE